MEQTGLDSSFDRPRLAGFGDGPRQERSWSGLNAS